MLVISSAAMGHLASHRLSKRVQFLEQFLQFISCIETEIRYSSSLIIEIIGAYKVDGELGQLIQKFYEILETHKEINKSWEAAVKNTYLNFGLKHRDAEIVTDFINKLGTNDTEGQMKHCQLNSKLIAECLKNAKEEKQKKSKLYFMMHASAGLCLALALV